MKHGYVIAKELAQGMVIVPTIRTMRHAIVERIKYRDDHPLVQVELRGKPADKSDVPRSMRNHKSSYVVVATDIGLRSFEAHAVVSVMVPSS